MKIEYAAKVDKGTKETNEDRVLVDRHVLDDDSLSGVISIPAVTALCDGCGGYSGGDVAAQMVLDILSLEESDTLCDPEYLSEVLHNCQQQLMRKKKETPSLSGMCTTIAGCVFGKDSILIFHSGDSRVYRHDKWSLERMTKDHSVVQAMINLGVITPEEALHHPKRNVINRCLGAMCLPPEIYVSHMPIQPGEKYLLCSDGLWESVRDEEIKEVLDSRLQTDQMADELIRRACKEGSDDNISVCLLTCNGNQN